VFFGEFPEILHFVIPYNIRSYKFTNWLKIAKKHFFYSLLAYLRFCRVFSVARKVVCTDLRTEGSFPHPKH